MCGQPDGKGGLPNAMVSIMQGCQSGFLFDMNTAVLTSYCVEMKDSTPSCPTCSPDADGKSWSQYMSCNAGMHPQDPSCYCEGTADREIGHQSAAEVSPRARHSFASNVAEALAV